jgi:hypothetical protein
VFCPGNRLTHRGGRGARHARREEGAYPLADIQPTSNAAGRDALVAECRPICGTGHYVRLWQYCVRLCTVLTPAATADTLSGGRSTEVDSHDAAEDRSTSHWKEVT